MSNNESILAADIESIDVLAEDLLKATYNSLMNFGDTDDMVMVFEGSAPFVMAEPMLRVEADEKQRLHVDSLKFLDEDGEIVDRLVIGDIDADVEVV